jgi:hypothetical protein
MGHSTSLPETRLIWVDEPETRQASIDTIDGMRWSREQGAAFLLPDLLPSSFFKSSGSDIIGHCFDELRLSRRKPDNVNWREGRNWSLNSREGFGGRGEVSPQMPPVRVLHMVDCD